ncbi:hypothetical protein A2976_01105 [candidate division WWE3 bacterium RIFCSPLOWO2_01_FULL_41_9]|jgi:lipoprotein signal peptidase|uniref:Uncharacterized protein n=1 Tax=candidate division WWE3 bacterium RIFCSPLOWO2_01_FULL_41_9 TaxID=1802626 RepID=A0A1F4VGX5_UNCKA|nr:MAG: hypothetical protein A2976_01105 [candidate division WWE3 bacterium RIFCSPLOWO2_01_FULL_41_9]
MLPTLTSKCNAHFFGYTVHQNDLIPFVLINMLLFSALLYIFRNELFKCAQVTLGISLIASGGTFNIAERIRNGCVEDYFSFLGLFLFNVWDIMVMSGILVLVFYITLLKRR